MTIPPKTSNVFVLIKSTMNVLKEMPREEFVQTIARLKMLEELREVTNEIIRDVEALKTSKADSKEEEKRSPTGVY